jgi:hypothetical protein
MTNGLSREGFDDRESAHRRTFAVAVSSVSSVTRGVDGTFRVLDRRPTCRGLPAQRL